MKRLWLKVVPKHIQHADGEWFWREDRYAIRQAESINASKETLSKLVDPSYELVAFRMDDAS